MYTIVIAKRMSVWSYFLQCSATTQMSNRPVLTIATSALFMLFAEITPMDFVAVALLVTKETAGNV